MPSKSKHTKSSIFGAYMKRGSSNTEVQVAYWCGTHANFPRVNGYGLGIEYTNLARHLSMDTSSTNCSLISFGIATSILWKLHVLCVQSVSGYNAGDRWRRPAYPRRFSIRGASYRCITQRLPRRTQPHDRHVALSWSTCVCMSSVQMLRGVG